MRHARGTGAPPAQPVTFTVQSSDPWNTIPDGFDQQNLVRQESPNERCITLPAPIAQGTLRTLRLREGLSVSISDIQPHVPVVIDWHFAETQPLLELHLHLSGEYTTEFSQPHHSLQIRPDTLYTTYLERDEYQGQIRFPTETRQTQIEICLLAPELEQADAPWRALLPTCSGSPASACALTRASALLPTLRATAMQLLDCPLTGAARALYIESKVLEILALALDAAQTHADPCTCALRPDDVERIYAARDLLLTRMDAPPALIELARAVGLNDFKLKQGFRQVFGTTVFGYLHAERMHQAHQLLHQGHMNVLEVAVSVGYASPSRFSAAFRRRFGINPSEVARARRSASATAQKPSARA